MSYDIYPHKDLPYIFIFIHQTGSKNKQQSNKKKTAKT